MPLGPFARGSLDHMGVYPPIPEKENTPDPRWVRMSKHGVIPVRIRCTACMEEYTLPMRTTWVFETEMEEIKAWVDVHPCDSLY